MAPSEETVPRPTDTATPARRGRRVAVQPLRSPHHHLGRPRGVRLARGPTHDPERLRQPAEVVRGAQPPEPDILLDPGGLRGGWDGALLLDLIDRILLDTTTQTARQVLQLLQHVIVGIAPIKVGDPARRHQAPPRRTPRGTAGPSRPSTAGSDARAACSAPDRGGRRWAPRAVRTAGRHAASQTAAAALRALTAVRRRPHGAGPGAKVVVCCRPRTLVTVGLNKDKRSTVAS